MSAFARSESNKALNVSSPISGLTFLNVDSESESEPHIWRTSGPSPRPRLLKAIGPSPIPRLRRVLNRETRYFESETRDSGNSEGWH